LRVAGYEPATGCDVSQRATQVTVVDGSRAA
jgi:hypothetical protein